MAKAKQADGEDTLVGWLVGVDLAGGGRADKGATRLASLGHVTKRESRTSRRGKRP